MTPREAARVYRDAEQLKDFFEDLSLIRRPVLHIPLNTRVCLRRGYARNGLQAYDTGVVLRAGFEGETIVDKGGGMLYIPAMADTFCDYHLHVQFYRMPEVSRPIYSHWLWYRWRDRWLTFEQFTEALKTEERP